MKILDELSYDESRIFRIDKNDDGSFTIVELCDEYFDFNLTKEQLIQLGNEIIELANS